MSAGLICIASIGIHVHQFVDSCQTMARYSRGGWAARGCGRLAVVLDMQRESAEEAARKKAPDGDPGGFDARQLQRNFT